VDVFTWGSSKEPKEIIKLMGEEQSLIRRSADPAEAEVGGLHQRSSNTGRPQDLF
jgi:hypothetical protein